MGRDYCSATDYPLVLEAARTAGEVWLVPICAALRAAGINWPNLTYGRGPTADALDRDITRAWAELGLHPQKGEK
jgi:hypothetical protein